jgi:hypothetical protein
MAAEGITEEADTVAITVDGFETASIYAEIVSPASPTGTIVDEEQDGSRDKDGQATETNHDAGYFLEPQFQQNGEHGDFSRSKPSQLAA